MKPKVSVIIPTFQRAFFLRRSVKSVLSQSFKNYELIIVDNASTDSTESEVKKFLKNNSNIIYIKNKKNVGMINNWNIGLKHARGQYISLLMDDDEWKPDFLKKTVAILDRKVHIGFVCVWVVPRTNQKSEQYRLYKSNKHLSGTSCLKSYIEDVWLVGLPSAVLFRRLSQNYFDQIGIDPEFWLRFAKNYDFYYLDKPLVLWENAYILRSFTASQKYCDYFYRRRYVLNKAYEYLLQDPKINIEEKNKYKNIKDSKINHELITLTNKLNLNSLPLDLLVQLLILKLRLFKTLIFKFITNIQNSLLLKYVDNSVLRSKWIENTLKKLKQGTYILDAGAGECQYKKYCKHLKYVSQDFAKYNGKGDGAGLQTNKWDNSKIDIVSDITNIPVKKSSFDAILCTEVFEHVPDPIAAIKEFKRILKVNGKLIITAPFSSLTHFAPYHFYTGFNIYFYRKILSENGFEIIEYERNGNYFDYLNQELRRLPEISQKYANTGLNIVIQIAQRILLFFLQKASNRNKGSEELLTFGYHVLAKKIK